MQERRGVISACPGLTNTTDGPSFLRTFSLTDYKSQPGKYGERWSHSRSWVNPRRTNPAPCAAMERPELPTC